MEAKDAKKIPGTKRSKLERLSNSSTIMLLPKPANSQRTMAFLDSPVAKACQLRPPGRFSGVSIICSSRTKV
jgi:hypothetical protein